MESLIHRHSPSGTLDTMKRKGKPFETGRTDLGSLLDEAEGKTAEKKPRKENEELDLDSAWSRS